MRMSEYGRRLLTEWEGGARNKVYQDAAGLPTIGVGHLLTRDELSTGSIVIDGVKVKYGNGLTDRQIDQLFTQDLAYAESVVNIGLGVDLWLTQNQYDALVSFVLNVGGSAYLNSTLRKLLLKKEYEKIPEQFRRWKHSGGKVLQGLINRREKEIKLFEGMI